MRALFYPLVGLAVILIATMVIAGLIVVTNGWRAKRATRNARWETFVEFKDGGNAEIGIRLVARWGGREKELQHDNQPERVSVDDLIARYDAVGRAQVRAQSMNDLRQDIVRGRE